MTPTQIIGLSVAASVAVTLLVKLIIDRVMRQTAEPEAEQPEVKTNTRIDWSKPVPFPKWYKIPKSVRVIKVAEDDEWVKKGSVGVTTNTDDTPFIKWENKDYDLDGEGKDWAQLSNKLAPIDPRQHPYHPEFGRAEAEQVTVEAKVEQPIEQPKAKRDIATLKPNEAIEVTNDYERDAILDLMDKQGWRWSKKSTPMGWRPPQEYPYSITYHWRPFSDIEYCETEFYTTYGLAILPASDFIDPQPLWGGEQQQDDKVKQLEAEVEKQTQRADENRKQMVEQSELNVQLRKERDEAFATIATLRDANDRALRIINEQNDLMEQLTRKIEQFGNSEQLNQPEAVEFKKGDYVGGNRCYSPHDYHEGCVINIDQDGDLRVETKDGLYRALSRSTCRHVPRPTEEAKPTEAAEPQIDWSKPQPFPEGYVVPKGIRIVVIKDAYKRVKDGVKGITTDCHLMPSCDFENGVKDQDMYHYEIAPLDPTDHPLHPEFKGKRQS